MNHLVRRVLRSTNGTRLFTMLVLASLLFSALTFLSPSGTGAQDGEVTTPVAEMQGGQTDTTSEVPETSEQPPTEVPPEENPVEATEPPSGGMASYIADARGCPPGFDLSAADASTALATCVEPLAGVAFSLGTQNPDYPGDTRTTGGDGYVAWSDIPVGTAYSVVESVPQGAGDPWVSCALTGGPGGDQYLYFPAPGGFMEIGSSNPGLADYAQTSCHWLTTPIGEAAVSPEANLASGEGEVQLANVLCPVNYKTADMTLPALRRACTTPGEGFLFTLGASSGAPRTGSSDAQGTLTWSGVPSGKLTIIEALPNGYQFSQPYCSVSPIGSGPGSPNSDVVQSDGMTITTQIAPGEALHCELFNIPMPESTVTIFPYLCPSDYKTADMTLGALQRGCQTPAVDVVYTMTSSDGHQHHGSTGSDGFVEWQHLPSGTVQIDETVPGGFLLGAAYCDPAPPQGELDAAPWQSPAYQDGVISYDVPARYSLSCFFFHIWSKPPALPTGPEAYTVNLTSYLCPADAIFDYLEDVANSSSQCHGASGWSYDHAGEGFAQSVMTDPVGATAVGQASAAPFTLTQRSPDGARSVALWCSSNGGAFRNMIGHDEDVFAYTPAAGEVLSCQWFNVERYPDGTYVTITIRKFLCGPDSPDSVVVENWRQTCPQPQAGVTFSAEQIGGNVTTGTTDESGIVTLRVQPGDVLLQTAPPDALDDGYTWCGAGDGESEPTYVNAGRVNAGEPSVPLSNIQPSLSYTCDWFTVPTDSPQTMTDGEGYVEVLKWRCPQGYDPAGSSFDQLRAACATPQPGVTIAVYYPSGESFTQSTRLEKGPAIARFEQLPTGDVGIGEPGARGHELKRVFCSTSAAPQAGLTEMDASAEYTVSDGGIAATIEAGRQLTCHFFNVPVADDDTPPTAGTIFLDKRSCPPGFAAVHSSYVDIAMYCASEASVEFTVTQGETELSAVTDEAGLAVFPKIRAGEIRISERTREGYDPPLAFCRETAEGAGATDDLDPVTVENWTTAYDLGPGSYLECVWANMPAATTSTDPGSVTLHAYICPERAGEDASFQELLALCTDRPEGVAFTVGQPLASPATGTTGSNGDVTFTGVAPGFVRIEQPAGQGYDPIASWCGYYDNASGNPADFARYSAQPQSAYIAGGYSLACYWFDVPYAEPATLDVTLRVCPPDFEPTDATNDRILAECTAIPTGVQVRAQAATDPGSDPEPGAYSATAAADENGMVSFEEVAPVALRIGELSARYETVRVNCGDARKGESPASYTALTTTWDGIDYPATPYTTITCYWAMLEAPPATVALHKRVCLPGDDYAHENRAELEAVCAPVEGIEFRVRNDEAAYETNQATDASGTATFPPVPPGTLQISELALDYLPVRVFCGYVPSGTTSEPAEFLELEIADDAVVYEAMPGAVISCDWFNIEASSSVTVHKYGCDEGDLPGGHSYQDDLQACPAPIEGVTFTLGAPSAQVSRDTDASGDVSWDAVAPGPLFISETPVPGYSDAVVYCSLTPAGRAEGAFAPVPVTQLAIEREIAAGDSLECIWFNYSESNHPAPAPIGTPEGEAGTPGPDSPASLILTRHTCAAGYDLHEPGANPTADCGTASSGIELTLAPLGIGGPAAETAVTDSDGVAAFSNLDPGSWLLTATLPENTLATFIASCQSDRRDFLLENPFTPFAYAGPEGQIGVVLIPGETLRCEAYDVPQSTVTIRSYDCPGTQVGPTACVSSTGPVAIRVAPVEGGEAITLTTNAWGVAYAGLPTGLFTITDRSASVCLIDSAALDEDGHLAVRQETPVELRVYTCT